MPYIGEIAGLLTSLCFALSALVFTNAVAKVGSIITNRARVVFALVYLVAMNLVLFGQPLPLQAEPSRWAWLALSGVIGLAIGDFFLFQAYLTIGPRLGLLLLSLSTVFGVLEAWLFLGEHLRFWEIIGIAFTLGGILWVILERGNDHGGNGLPQLSRSSLLGIGFGVLAGLGQATGLVFSRQGMQGNFSPISGNAIRMLAAVVTLWLIAAVQKQAGSTIAAMRADKSALKLVALAAFIGPVAGVSFSLLAVQNTAVGIASVLTSLAPIFMLPFSYFFLKERIGWQPIAGTLLAMAGVVILFIA